MARGEKPDFVEKDALARPTILLIIDPAKPNGVFSPRAIMIIRILKSRNSIYKRAFLD